MPRTETMVYVGGCSGSFAVPSENRPIWDPDHARNGVRPYHFQREIYGGRTTTFFIRHKDTFIIFDHGSGIDPASDLIVQMLEKEGKSEATIWVVMSHFHMDHVNGTPSNQLLYRKGVTLKCFSPDLSAYRPIGDKGHSLEKTFRSYFNESGIYWPVPIQSLASVREHTLFPVGEALNLGGIKTHTMALKHSGGCCGYRFEIPGVGAVVIATDNEPGLEIDPTLVEFFDGAHLLVADMQYRDEEYSGEKAIGTKQCPRAGWGHATPQRLFPHILACKKQPQMVRITHHDSQRSDTELTKFCDDSADLLTEMGGGNIDYSFARGNDIYWL